MLESFPVVVSKGAYKENDANVLISILAVIRGIRIKYGIKMDRAISFYIDSASKMEGYRSDFAKANITLLKTRAKNVKHVPYSVAGKNIFVEFNFENTEDTKKNKETLLKNLLFEIKRSKKILGNKSFVKNAPKEKVLAEKQKLENYQKEYDKLLEPKH
jgi:valyl-tRNA synthetase